MFYVIGVGVPERKRAFKSTILAIKMDTDEIDEDYSMMKNIFTIFDDTDCSFETIDMEFLVYCNKLGIQIKGVESYVNVFDSGNKRYYLKVSEQIIPMDNLFRLKRHESIHSETGKCNQYFLNKIGVNTDTHYFLVDSDEFNSGTLIKILPNGVYKKLVHDRNKCINEYGNKLAYIRGTLIVSEITDNSVFCFYMLDKVMDLLYSNTLTLFHLYLLTFFYPSYTVGSTIVSDTEFIVDNMTDRFVFEVNTKLYASLCKNKLLGNDIF